MNSVIHDVKGDVYYLQDELTALEAYEGKINAVDQAMRVQNEALMRLERQQVANFNMASRIRGQYISNERAAELRRMLSE